MYRVVMAWVDKGRNPEWHDNEAAELRRRWPSLALALDAMAIEYGIKPDDLPGTRH